MNEVQLNYGSISIRNGEVVLAEKTDKLIQDIAKVIATPRNGEFHPLYGCDLNSYVGLTESDIDVGEIRSIISQAIAYLQNIQSRQAFVEEIQPEELVVKLGKVDVQKLDATSYTIFVEIIDGTGQTRSIDIPV